MVLDQTWPEYQVIVVDQSPVTAPALASYLEAHRGRIEYYRLPKPNSSVARNVGIHKAKGDIIIFLDDDIEISRDYVASHLASYEGTTVSGVTGLVFWERGQALADAIAGARTAYGIRGDLSETAVPVKWMCGGNTSYRRKVLFEAGLFDERFTGSAWAEDADMAVRIRRLGHELMLNPKIRLFHLALPSGGCYARDPAVRDRVVKERARLWTFYCVKNWDMVGLRQVLVALYRGYRALALNRPLFRAGLKQVVQGHVVFIGAIYEAFRGGPHGVALPPE